MASQKDTKKHGSTPATNNKVGWRDASDTSSGFLGTILGNGKKTESPDQKKNTKSAPSDTETNSVSIDEEPTPVVTEGQQSTQNQPLVQSVLNGLDDSTLLVDEDGRITHINESALELYDIAEHEAIGRQPQALQAEDSQASDIVAEALDRGEDISQRTEQVRVGGTEVLLERTATLLNDDQGRVAGTMLVETDSTAHTGQQENEQYLVEYQKDVLGGLRGKLARFAEGDLTIDPTVKEPEYDTEEVVAVYDEFVELNEYLITAVESIRDVVETLTESADDLSRSGTTLSANSQQVTASIQEIDASSTEMARGADSLAEDTQRASENVEDLSASVEEITASVQQIDAQSEEVARIASKGVDDASEAVSQIRDATEATSTVARRIDSLEESMEEVVDIIDIIANIADQTNLLALNANIEAARAGEAGDGFAVVADEVKNLAEDSQESADDIAEIITEVRDQTSDLVKSIEDANTEVKEGADDVDTLVDRLDAIDSRAKQTSEGLNEISIAVESQAENAEEVSSVIDDTSGLTEEITASIQQISSGIDEQADAMVDVAANAQQLSALSDDFHRQIDLFKLTNDESANLMD